MTVDTEIKLFPTPIPPTFGGGGGGVNECEQFRVSIFSVRDTDGKSHNKGFHSHENYPKL